MEDMEYLKTKSAVIKEQIFTMPSMDRIENAIKKAHFLKGYVYESSPNVVGYINYIIDVLEDIQLEEGD